MMHGVKWLIACLPLLAVLCVWAKVYRTRYMLSPLVTSFIALGFVTALAALAAGTCAYFDLRPERPSLQPWESREFGLFGSLFLLSPIGMILGFVASRNGAPKWLWWTVEIVATWLFLLGVMVGISD